MSFLLSFFQKLLAMEAKKDNEDSAPYSTAGLYIIWRYAMLQSFFFQEPLATKAQYGSAAPATGGGLYIGYITIGGAHRYATIFPLLFPP